MKKYIYSERVDLFEPNIYINFLVQLLGNPEPDILISAVKAAFAANEATMSKIILDSTGEAFYEQMQESGCRVEISKEGWYDLIRSNEKVPFAIDKGEFLRVFIITSEEDVFLLIMAHHLVGDGKSITYLIEDIMKALSGEYLSFKEMQLITKDSLPKKSELPFLIKRYIGFYNRRWKHTGRSFQWGDYYSIHKTYWKERSSHIAHEYFSPEEIGRIHAHVKKIGISVNSYIATAFLEADRSNGIIGIAVDARMDGNKSISNQATGITVDHIFSDGMSFDENAKLVHQKVLYKLMRPKNKFFILQVIPLFTPSLLDSVLLFTYGLYHNKTTQKLAKLMGYKDGSTRDLGITNLTRLDIPNQYGAYEIKKLLFIPPVISYAKHIIGVSTMEDGMSITYHYMNDQEREVEFFKRAIQTLKSTYSQPI
ncbi:MAG: condensation domain protein [Herbinix sp.]|jgi:hypothetical protein|nr:condensation domain protein [Herbinix sp.]